MLAHPKTIICCPMSLNAKVGPNEVSNKNRFPSLLIGKGDSFTFSIQMNR